MWAAVWPEGVNLVWPREKWKFWTYLYKLRLNRDSLRLWINRWCLSPTQTCELNVTRSDGWQYNALLQNQVEYPDWEWQRGYKEVNLESWSWILKSEHLLGPVIWSCTWSLGPGVLDQDLHQDPWTWTCWATPGLLDQDSWTRNNHLDQCPLDLVTYTVDCVTWTGGLDPDFYFWTRSHGHGHGHHNLNQVTYIWEARAFYLGRSLWTWWTLGPGILQLYTCFDASLNLLHP